MIAAIGLASLMAAAFQQASIALPDRRLVSGATVVVTGRALPAGTLSLKLHGDSDSAELGSAAVANTGILSHTVRVPPGIRAGAYRLVAVAGGGAIAALDVAVLDAATRGDSAAPRSRQATSRVAPVEHGMADTAATAGRDEGRAVLGYDWPRLHAALNDLPAALLVFALLCELVGLVTRRESLRAAGFWALIAGVTGMAAAAVAGLMAENRVAHDDVAHEVMSRHKTLALISFALFAILLLWKIVRRYSARRVELVLWSLTTTVAVALLIAASQLGGTLIFDHALGVPSPTLRAVLERRGDMPLMDMADSSGADSTAQPSSARPHRDRPGTAPHSH